MNNQINQTLGDSSHSEGVKPVKHTLKSEYCKFSGQWLSPFSTNVHGVKNKLDARIKNVRRVL